MKRIILQTVIRLETELFIQQTPVVQLRNSGNIFVTNVTRKVRFICPLALENIPIRLSRKFGN